MAKAKTKKKTTKKMTKKAAPKKGAPKKVMAKKATAKKAAPKMSKAVSPKKTATKKTATKTTPSKPANRILVGQTVPNFEAAATGNKNISLEALKGKKVVLYFYPKDKTPGCTLEGHDFTKLYEQFKDSNTEILGVSRDTVSLHEDFKSCENYSFDLLSDEDEKLCTLFDVIKMKNMYGKQVRGIERSTFVIDADGKLLKEWRGVNVPGHAQEVLEYVKGVN